MNTTHAAILSAHNNLFTPTNTHDLREGDIIRTHGMVLRIGAKQISDQAKTCPKCGAAGTMTKKG